MQASRGRTLHVALLLVASGGCVSSAHAADTPFSMGALYGYGNRTNVNGAQLIWAPQEGNEFLAPHDLGLRLTGQVARWVASESDAQYHSLTDGSVLAELRYWLSSEATVRPFVEAGLGLHLLSKVRIADRQLGVPSISALRSPWARCSAITDATSSPLSPTTRRMGASRTRTTGLIISECAFVWPCPSRQMQRCQ
jgi:hypothetical protein